VSVKLVVPSKEELIFVYGPPETVPRYTLYPITVELSVQVKVAKWFGWTPVPDKLMDAGEFEALLTTEALPVTLPVAAGAKVTFKVAI
jgi:hypothetical protein